MLLTPRPRDRFDRADVRSDTAIPPRYAGQRARVLEILARWERSVGASATPPDRVSRPLRPA